MTDRNPTTIPTKNIRFCPDTRDYEFLIDDDIIGYAPTQIRAYEIANEFIYLQLTANHGNPSEVSPEDAEALLAVQMLDVPMMVELAAQEAAEHLEAATGVPEARPLPPMHPVVRLVAEAAWWTNQVLQAA